MSQDTNRRIVLAGFLIVIGIILLLRNFELLPWLPEYVFTWPMLLVLIGTYILLTKQRIIPSLIFIGIGLYFLMDDIFEIYYDDFWMLWPLILIAIGISLVLRGRSSYYDRHSKPGSKDSDLDYIDNISIFSGNEKIINSQEFKGGKITNIFGGSEINLLNAKLAAGNNYIDIVTVFGGSTIIVPANWNIKVDILSIFGGFVDKREYKETNPAEPVLYIKGFTLFGGGEIKSHK
jgi:predicted membrane protein